MQTFEQNIIITLSVTAAFQPFPLSLIFPQSCGVDEFLNKINKYLGYTIRLVFFWEDTTDVEFSC